jgi:hypothetical protein
MEYVRKKEYQTQECEQECFFFKFRWKHPHVHNWNFIEKDVKASRVNTTTFKKNIPKKEKSPRPYSVLAIDILHHLPQYDRRGKNVFRTSMQNHTAWDEKLVQSARRQCLQEWIADIDVESNQINKIKPMLNKFNETWFFLGL